MSQPATNTVQTFNLPFTTVWSSTPGVSYPGSQLGGKIGEEKAAAVNGARDGKFKLQTSWTHKGGNLRKLPSSEEYHPVPSITVSCKGNIYDGPMPASVLPGSNLQNKAITKCLANLKNQSFHAGNFLAESGKTVELIGGAAGTIRKGVLSFRKKYPGLWPIVRAWQTGGLPRHLWCKIPRQWLALQYGWTPLMSDIWGAAKHLSERSRFSRPYVTVKGNAEDRVTSTTTHHSQFAATSVATWVHEQKCRCVLIYGLNNPTLVELSALGLINPAEIVWETLRYSFVVDWFLPVGSWLSSLTADVGYSFITGSSSKKVRTTWISSTYEKAPPSFPGQRGGPIGFDGKWEEYVRAALTGTPFPGLYVKNPLSTLHALNAIALMAQAFK